jgi:FlaA1/EpsC-like NDP-sugar epimerase
MEADLQQFDNELKARLSGRNLLVIGGAGTIGAAFIKVALRYPVSRLCVVDVNENGLTELVRDVRSTPGLRAPESLLTYPINFDDRVFSKIFHAHGPFHVVANFAAHKHVRSEKDIFSIEAMLDNNVLRANRLLELILSRPPERFFCVSTDKAANPVNVMGASKKLMEELLSAYSSRLPVTTARFANVAFSNGSLLSGFLDRLAKRQPWSCPRNIRRYFVSTREAGELCLIAAMLADAGEIVYPKLDRDRDLISFEAIARNLLDELGLEPDECATEDEALEKAAALGPVFQRYPVHFFESDTSGEKPDEEFIAGGEKVDEQRFDALGVILKTQCPTVEYIDGILHEIRSCLDNDQASKESLIGVLQQFLPSFSHIEKGKTLDQRM